METKQTTISRILQLTREAGILRPRDLKRHGFPGEYLRRMTENGLLVRVARGLYTLPDAEPTEHRSLAEVSKRVPNGIICLLSALQFHGLTTQSPFEVWLAIDGKAARPRLDWPPVRIITMSGKARTYGIEDHTMEGVLVRVYSPEKTVADCFKYRNKIGLDVALEALREYRLARGADLDQLWQASTVCEVVSIMRPYLEVTDPAWRPRLAPASTDPST